MKSVSNYFGLDSKNESKRKGEKGGSWSLMAIIHFVYGA